jgi:hypothetical protein
MLAVIMLSVILIGVNVPSVIMAGVVMPNVVMPIVVASVLRPLSPQNSRQVATCLQWGRRVGKEGQSTTLQISLLALCRNGERQKSFKSIN